MNPPRRAAGMKLLLLILAISGGAIINVAVAWGCALWASVQEVGSSFDKETRIKRLVYEGTGVSKIYAATYPDAPFTGILHFWPERQEVGFPLRAMASVSGSDRIQLTHRTSRMLGARLIEPTLPFAPKPVGFAINTIFYAGILWLLFAVPFKLRRWRRIKRGQCASCGYSLQGGRGTPHIDKCPECGTCSPSPAERERVGVRAE